MLRRCRCDKVAGDLLALAETEQGRFARGEAVLEGIGKDPDSRISIQFQNENLVAARDEEIVVSVPRPHHDGGIGHGRADHNRTTPLRLPCGGVRHCLPQTLRDGNLGCARIRARGSPQHWISSDALVWNPLAAGETSQESPIAIARKISGAPACQGTGSDPQLMRSFRNGSDRRRIL